MRNANAQADALPAEGKLCGCLWGSVASSSTNHKMTHAQTDPSTRARGQSANLCERRKTRPLFSMESPLHQLPQFKELPLEGWLYKQAENGLSWSLRYFRLDIEQRRLCYYENDRAVHPNGAINLSSVMEVLKKREGLINKWTFDLVTPTRVYTLLTKSGTHTHITSVTVMLLADFPRRRRSCVLDRAT
jgi:hypothetical protein